MRSKGKKQSNKHSFSIYLASFFFCLIAVAIFLEKLPIIVLALYFGSSLLTFLFYYLDKSAARKGTWRTPERTLHLLAVVGGWPGALLAQQILRHKSKKSSFRLVFWITVILNLAGLIWLFLFLSSAL